MGTKLKIIGIEEHYATPEFMEGPGRQLNEQAKAAKAHPDVAAGVTRLFDQLIDIGEGRIAEMDAAGIDAQVLSLTAPGIEQMKGNEAIALAKSVNNSLSAAVKAHPGRFYGFAALPVAEPASAAEELERMVSGHGFKGAMINGHIGSRYLDDTFFWPIFERAATLHVPVYLHPTPPPQAVFEASCSGNYSPLIASLLSTAGWGWHIETALHMLRIILSGAFDKYPGLQLVIGHMGETLPFMLQRLDHGMPPQVTKLQRPISAYLRENVHYTFGGFNYIQPFLDLLLQVGSDRIMFSSDHPYASMEQGQVFMEQLPVSDADKQRIAHGNAERLLRL